MQLTKRKVVGEATCSLRHDPSWQMVQLVERSKSKGTENPEGKGCGDLADHNDSSLLFGPYLHLNTNRNIQSLGSSYINTKLHSPSGLRVGSSFRNKHLGAGEMAYPLEH